MADLDTSIATLIPLCLNAFREFATTLVAKDGEDSAALQNSLTDQNGRFKVWAGNIGAHQTGKSSLDYRLRDASHIRTRVVRFLKDLQEQLNEAMAIVNGVRPTLDDLATESEVYDSDSSDESDNFPKPTELQQIFYDIEHIITCLYKISVTVRNPTPHDRYIKAHEIDTSFFEPYDIQHVKGSYPKAPEYLAVRIGKAISRRRQYFKYRELHGAKIAQNLDADNTKTTLSETTASGYNEKSTTMFASHRSETASICGMTETSYATSAGSLRGNSARMPSMPKAAANVSGLTRIRKHLAHHLEGLALFALPNDIYEDELHESSTSISDCSEVNQHSLITKSELVHLQNDVHFDKVESINGTSGLAEELQGSPLSTEFPSTPILPLSGSSQSSSLSSQDHPTLISSATAYIANESSPESMTTSSDGDRPKNAAYQPAAAPVQVQTPPPQPDTSTANNKFARLEKLLIDQKAEQEAKEAAKEAIAYQPAAAPVQVQTPPPQPDTSTANNKFARLEKLLMDQKAEQEAKEAAKEAIVIKVAADRAVQDLIDKKITDDLAAARAAATTEAEVRAAENAAKKAREAEAEKKAVEEVNKKITERVAKKLAEAAKKAAEEAAAKAKAE
ncbi:MAG: hypothetical protein Q9187_006480 [Circinaria calcarea]